MKRNNHFTDFISHHLSLRHCIVSISLISYLNEYWCHQNCEAVAEYCWHNCSIIFSWTKGRKNSIQHHCLYVTVIWSWFIGLHMEMNETFVRFEVFIVVKIQVRVLWVVTLCSVVVGYQCFTGSCYLHLHPAEHYTVSQPRRPWLESDIYLEDIIYVRVLFCFSRCIVFKLCRLAMVVWAALHLAPVVQVKSAVVWAFPEMKWFLSIRMR
jgi:hypothetical protein